MGASWHLLPELRADPLLVRAAVQTCSCALVHASSECWDHETVLLALKSLKTQSGFLGLLEEMPRALAEDERMMQLIGDRAFISLALQQHKDALKIALPNVQADREIAMASVAQWGLSLKYVSPDLQADPEVVTRAILSTP